MTYAEEDPQFLEHIKEAWPGLEEDEYPDLLMSVTAFPFARAPVIIDQLTAALHGVRRRHTQGYGHRGCQSGCQHE